MGQDLVAVRREDALLSGGLYPVEGSRHDIDLEVRRARLTGRLRKKTAPQPWPGRPGVFVAYLLVDPPRPPFWTTWRKVAAGVAGLAVVGTILAALWLALPYIIAGAVVAVVVLLLAGSGAVRHCPGCRG